MTTLAKGLVGVLLLCGLVLAPGCRSLSAPNSASVASHLSLESRLEPSNDRDWIPPHAVLASVDLDGDHVLVHNVRNFRYFTDNDFLVQYEDRSYRLSDLETVDFVVTPFEGAPLLAHTMLSFGFRGGQYLVASVEVRLEQGETYSPVLGAMRQFELMYVLADEQDVIRLRTEVRHNNVYVYRSTATPRQTQDLFLDIVARVNELRDNPEFYDTFTNNCTTNIVRHINDLSPGSVPYDLKVLLPGLSPQLAYDLGLLDKRVPYSELTRRANVTAQALRYRDSPDFSQRIRR